MVSCDSRVSMTYDSSTFIELILIVIPFTGRLEASLKGHKGSATSTSISHDDKYIISWTWDGEIKIWNISTKQCEATLGCHIFKITAVLMSNDNKYFVSVGSRDGTIEVWNMITKRCDSTRTSTSGVIGLSVSPDNGNVISLLADGRVMTWNMGNNKCEEILKCRIGHVYEISCDCRYIAIVPLNSITIEIWNMNTKGREATLTSVGRVSALSISHDRYI